MKFQGNLDIAGNILTEPPPPRAAFAGADAFSGTSQRRPQPQY
jgi:hypothetical protein